MVGKEGRSKIAAPNSNSLIVVLALLFYFA